MKNYFKWASWILSLSFIVTAGCKNNSDDKQETKQVKKNYDIFIYNSDTSVGTALRTMCDEYTSRTGVIIRTVTPGDDENTTENLESYMNSDYPPDIFTVKNMQEMKKWQSSENIWDFSNATEDSFKNVANEIPSELRLGVNPSNNFGLPATVTGYGYVVDPKMISSLVGGGKYRTALQDLRECSYDEFRNFVEVLNSYIQGGSSQDFTLNEKPYSLASSKGELSGNLDSVFSFPASDEKMVGSYMMNTVLASVFKSPSHANTADDSFVEKLSSPIMKFMEALELITNNTAFGSGSIGRGPEFISSSQNSLTRAIKNFVSGKSVFLPAGTKDYDALSTFDSLVAKRCVFIPIKMPFGQFDITSSESVANKLHKSISVYCPLYYCINAKSSYKEKKSAQNFLTWFKTSDLAEKYIIPEMKYVPYNTKESSVIDSSLERSMVEYISETNTVPGVFQGTPEKWCNETVGKYIMDKLLTKAFWNLEDYEEIANYSVMKWKELN